MSTTENGTPIYSDDTEYSITDSVGESDSLTHPHPSNKAAQKLYRCIECMRDIREVLDTIQIAKAPDKRRRRTKLLFTPLYSFVDCMLDVLHDVQTNPSTVSDLDPSVRSTAVAMEKRLMDSVPFGRAGILRELRNKMSAHVDKDLHSIEAKALFSQVAPASVGLWLHSAITVLADLLKLPIYQWTCGSRFPDCIGVISPTIPLLTVFETSHGSLTRIAGCFLLKRDPRSEVYELLRSVVESSTWMFGPHDPKIQGFVQDEKGSSWAKSLETLPPSGWKQTPL